MLHDVLERPGADLDGWILEASAAVSLRGGPSDPCRGPREIGGRAAASSFCHRTAATELLANNFPLTSADRRSERSAVLASIGHCCPIARPLSVMTSGCGRRSSSHSFVSVWLK